MANAFPAVVAAGASSIASCTATGVGTQTGTISNPTDFLYSTVSINGAGITHSNSVFTLNPGTYFVLSSERHSGFSAVIAYLRWSIVDASNNATMTGTAAGQSLSVTTTTQSGGNEVATGIVNITATTSIKVRCSQTNGAIREPISAVFTIIKLT